MSDPYPTCGQLLGHYRILDQIGAGGMGVVFRARDERLERVVALKILLPGALADESSRKQFRREALALAKLNYPGIATIHDFDAQDGIDFLVMEYIVGITLVSKLGSSMLPDKEVVSIAQQIVTALDRAHQFGVVHRDLKPGNVMITPTGEVKLLDFGLSLLLKPASETALTETISLVPNAVGTLTYMAPEQLRGEHLDSRCDIYAAGVIMYEMATGHRPFEATLSTRMIADILNKPVLLPQTINPNISPRLANIILKCLEKDPENRYQSAKEVVVDLRGITAAEFGAAVAKPLPAAGRRTLPIFAISVALLLALVTAFTVGNWRASRSGASTVPIHAGTNISSLAVLPLDNLSADPTQEYFTDGMTEELIDALAMIGELRVVSRTSVMQYKKVHKPLPQIARELRVDAIVTGSVSYFADSKRVRITAQLVDAATDRNLWSQSYERDLSDIFALQDDVARNIALRIRVQLTPQEQVRLSSPRSVKSEAHDAFLRGRYHWNKGTEKEYREAKTYFEQAAQIDPTYAAAFAGLADYYWATDELPPRVAAPKATDYARKALVLDEMLSGTHTTLGAIQFFAHYNWTGAEEEFKRAVELNQSDADAHQMYAVFLSAMGRADEALSEIKTARLLNPLDPTPIVTTGSIFYFARQYDRSIEQCNDSLELDHTFYAAHDCLGSAYLAKRNYQKAITECRLAVAGSGDDPVRLVGLGRAYALDERKVDANRVLTRLRTIAKVHYVPPYFFVQIHAALGEKKQALAWLARAYHDRDFYLTQLKVDDTVDPLRSDPRFEEILHDIGLAPALMEQRLSKER
jgi:TolB-like protein/Flp pilus assembly protein TadD